MKTTLIALLLASGLCAQAPVANITLPTYISGGGAYNQLAGFNLWFSAIVPVANTAGLYESTTTDLFPTKSATAAGKSIYTFQTSIRQGVHKVLHDDPKNTLLIGADAGVTFSSVGSVSNTGFAGAATVTYIRHLNPHFGFIFPVRALYTNGLGWNPILEAGLVWKS